MAILRGRPKLAEDAYCYVTLINFAVVILLGLRRALRSIEIKAHWALFCSAYGLYAVSLIFEIWGPVLFRHMSLVFLGSLLDFTYICALIPLFLLVSLPAGRQYIRYFLWIDGAQAAMAAYLFYVVVLRALPFAPAPVAPDDRMSLIHLFLLGDISIAAGFSLHYFAAINLNEKRFFRMASIGFCCEVLVDSIFNPLVVRYPDESLFNIPYFSYYLLLSVFILLLPGEEPLVQPARLGLLADMINIASPALVPGALLALGIAVVGRYKGLGLGAVATAFLLFALRAAIYQRSFEQSRLSLEEAQVRLQRMSYTDELTGVANRRAFEEALRSEWERGARSHAPLSLILIDVDYFKQLNDTHGHQAGDLCLVRVAQALQGALPRKLDVLGRYGGDEFAAILPGTNTSAAEVVAHRLWQAVHDLSIETPGLETAMRMSVSMGVATSTAFGEASPQLLLQGADDALYLAKAAGRDGWRSVSEVQSSRSYTNPEIPTAEE